MSVERLQPPYGGMNTDASPDYVAGTQAPLLENLLPGRAGKVVMRGALSAINANARGLLTDQRVNCWVSGDTVLVAGSGGTYKVLTLGGGAATTITPSPAGPDLAATAPRPARVSGMVFGRDSGGVLTRWNPTGNVFTRQSNAPTNFQSLTLHLQRLFVLGGTKPGTATASPRSLFWTDPLDPSNPDATALASWQDDSSGLTNEIVLPDGDFYVAVTRCGRNLVVLGLRTVVLLVGDSPSSLSMRVVAHDWGLSTFQPRSVVESDDGIYYVGGRGLVFYDGLTFRSLTENLVMQAYFEAVPQPTQPAFVAALDGGYLLVGLNDVLLLLHVQSGAWSKVSSPLLTSSNLDAVTTDNFTALWDGTGFLYAGGLGLVERATGGNRGDTADGTAFKAIQPRLESKWFKLASPLDLATLRSLLLDYAFTIDPASAQKPSTGFRVSLRDTLGTTLLATTGLPAEVAATPRRQRAQLECFAEADAVQLVVDWAYDDSVVPPPTLLRAELYDGFLDFQASRERGPR